MNVGYRSTNFWVVSAGTSRLLVDLGWPGTMPAMLAGLERAGVPLRDLRYGFATHYHVDHAGLAQDLKLAGVPLLVADVQVPWISHIKDHIKPTDRFTDILLHDNVVTTIAESRELLLSIGMEGQLLHTPGHSPDSVSLLLDSGAVFTGDLTHPMLIAEDEAAVTNASWDLLKASGATTVHAGHGPVRPI